MTRKIDQNLSASSPTTVLASVQVSVGILPQFPHLLHEDAEGAAAAMDAQGRGEG